MVKPAGPWAAPFNSERFGGGQGCPEKQSITARCLTAVLGVKNEYRCIPAAQGCIAKGASRFNQIVMQTISLKSRREDLCQPQEVGLWEFGAPDILQKRYQQLFRVRILSFHWIGGFEFADD